MIGKVLKCQANVKLSSSTVLKLEILFLTFLFRIALQDLYTRAFRLQACTHQSVYYSIPVNAQHLKCPQYPAVPVTPWCPVDIKA